jgi:2-dehydropantoate 2-reductase
MKIAVVGAGAMGSLFGGRLAEGGQDVWLVDVWREHVDAIRAGGLACTEQGETRRIAVRATTRPDEIGPVELVIVLVKHNETAQAIRDAAPVIDGRTVVLSLQNGLGNVDLIRAAVPEGQVVMGLTTLTSVVRGPGHIEANFLGRGETYVWPVTGVVSDGLRRGVAAMNEARLYTEISPDAELRIWRKLVVNAGVTALSAAVRLSIGDIAAHANAREILDATTREIVEVAQKKRIPLSYADAIAYLYDVSAQAKDHIGSMTVDVSSRRRTEIEAISGAVVREGARVGVPTPANRFVYNMIRIIEDTYDRRV